METNTYTILEEKREDMEKKLRRLEKKAKKYDIPFSVSYGEPYAIEIKRTDDFGKKYTQKYEVFDLTIESETIRKDGYTVLAHIEHGDDGNVVDVFEGQMQTEWVNIKPFCAHCNANHNLKYTFMVSNGNEIKQVGRTCLKEYCGIDPQMIGMMNSFHDDIDEYTPDGYDFGEGLPCVYDAVEVLAFAIEAIKKQGYVKSDERDSNKGEIIKAVGHRHPSKELLAEAETMAKAIAEMSVEEAVNARLNNVQVRIKGFYCKPSEFGYFAYAPIAYERHMKYIEAQKRKAEEKAKVAKDSEYVGNVGERAEFRIKEMTLLTTFPTDYGTTFLYRFIDQSGNILIWFASGSFGAWKNGKWETYENVSKIKATIKAHNEREGVKQTILTRVKVA